MTTASPSFRRIVRDAAKATEAAYRRAVALSVEQSDLADAAWRRWGDQYAVAWGLTVMSAAEAVIKKAKPVERFEKEKPVEMIAEGLTVSPFDEMTQAFADRMPLLAPEAALLSERAASVARAAAAFESRNALPRLAAQSNFLRSVFFVTGADTETTQNVRMLVAEVIRSGSTDAAMTLPDFIDKAQLQGASNLTGARLETVLRTNLTSAAVDGQRAAYEKPEVKRVAPLVMLLEIHDRRTRGAPGTDNPGFHWQMDGYINTEEAYTRQGIWPPAGYNCRATTRPVSLSEAMRMGLVDARGQLNSQALARYNGERQKLIDRGLYPDPGFRRVA